MEALPLSLVVRASSTKLRDLPGIDELRELEGLFAGRTLISFEAEARETVRGALDRAGVSSTVPLRMVEPLRAPRIADTLIPVTPNFGYRGEQGLNAGDLLRIQCEAVPEDSGRIFRRNLCQDRHVVEDRGNIIK